MNVIVFGAHPDDCELRVGGCAAKWSALGHRVKFVAVVNGDTGHHEMGGGPLARRRATEVAEAAQILGIETQVLDNHDGELLPTLEVRKELIRQIRRWGADLVITHRPYDYHPDHRYTSISVQDTAYTVTVPSVCPDTPSLRRNPVFMYMWDSFQKPYPFQAHVVVSVEDVYEKKLAALSVIKSQALEWIPWHKGFLDQVPKDSCEAKHWLRGALQPWLIEPRQPCNAQLEKWYGAKAAAGILQIEPFEICEYGRQPTEGELRGLFPFFHKREEAAQ